MTYIIIPLTWYSKKQEKEPTMPRDKIIKRSRLTYDTDIGTIRYGIKITMKNMAKTPVEKVDNTHCQMSNFSRKGNYKEKKNERLERKTQ